MKGEVLAAVAEYVTDIFKKGTPYYLTYHNLTHTEEVVLHSLEIALFSGVPDDEKNVLLAAGWFHDIGQLFTTPEKHEEKGVEIMQSFLQSRCHPSELSQIAALILATKVPTHPNTLLEQIICDADTYHLGTKAFWEKDSQVKEELELRTKICFGNWEQLSLRLLKEHRFYTAYCKAHLEAGKRENIEELEYLVNSV